MDCVSNQSITTLPSFASMNQRSLVFRISLIGIDRSRLLPFSFLNGSIILSCKQKKKKRTKKLFSPHNKRYSNNEQLQICRTRVATNFEARSSNKSSRFTARLHGDYRSNRVLYLSHGSSTVETSPPCAFRPDNFSRFRSCNYRHERAPSAVDAGLTITAASREIRSALGSYRRSTSLLSRGDHQRSGLGIDLLRSSAFFHPMPARILSSHHSSLQPPSATILLAREKENSLA